MREINLSLWITFSDFHVALRRADDCLFFLQCFFILGSNNEGRERCLCSNDRRKGGDENWTRSLRAFKWLPELVVSGWGKRLQDLGNIMKEIKTAFFALQLQNFFNKLVRFYIHGRVLHLFKDAFSIWSSIHLLTSVLQHDLDTEIMMKWESDVWGRRII